VLVVPIALGSDPLGVLLVAAPRPFHEVDRAAAGVFAGHAALALEVARAQDDQRRLALYEERDRIARDLHDSVIQQLFGTGLRAQGLREIVTQPGIADRIDEFVTDLDRTIRDIRRTIFDLQEVPEPEPVSLRGQILRVVHDATRALHLEPVVTVAGPLEAGIPDEVRLDVLTTLREALSNAVRHAGAGQVYVEVTVVEPAAARPGRVDLRVRDDGRGIPPGARRGSGLANMGDRAARWGGRCVVERGVEGGTQVHWSVPLPRDPDEDEP
jgi:signal transduction histidine kinase